MERKHRINLMLTFIVGFFVLFGGLIVSFFVLNAYFSLQFMFITDSFGWPIDPALLEQLLQGYGLSGPLFFRLLRYVGDFLSGSWGYSVIFSAPLDITLRGTVLRTIELLIFPLIIGIILGFKKFGKVSNRTKRNWLRTGNSIIKCCRYRCSDFLFWNDFTVHSWLSNSLVSIYGI